ncbi:MAG: hypothetical protein M3256_10910 [Actinomycetota bacterium]|nr:hypothetical protein [Actinomycetota bacterium]
MDNVGLPNRRSTVAPSRVCGFYRFAHIEGPIGTNPAQYVRCPQVHPSDARGVELGVSLFTAEH